MARVPVTPVPCGVAGLPKACGGKPCDEGDGVPARADQSRDPNDTRWFGTKLATAIPALEGLAFRLASAPALYFAQSRYREACSDAWSLRHADRPVGLGNARGFCDCLLHRPPGCAHALLLILNHIAFNRQVPVAVKVFRRSIRRRTRDRLWNGTETLKESPETDPENKKRTEPSETSWVRSHDFQTARVCN